MNTNNKILIGVIVVLCVAIGVVAFKILQPERPTKEQANLILAEALQNTLGLDSFTSEGGMVFKAKDGEITILQIALEDMQISGVNVFDFVEQDTKGVYTYSILINFNAIIDFIERVKTPEKLKEIEYKEKIFGIMRALGETNVLVTYEMKSIDFNTYLKVVEIKGLREAVTKAGEVFIAEGVMGKIEPHLGIWYKIPAPDDPRVINEMKKSMEEMTAMVEKAEVVFPAFYVKEVLPNTRVNGVPVYNFVTGIDLDVMRNIVISLMKEMAKDMNVEEKEIVSGIKEFEKIWPKVASVIETIETDFRIYICQETRLIKKQDSSVNIGLYEFMTVIKEVMVKTQEIEEAKGEVTPRERIRFEEGKADFVKIKEMVKNISIVGTMNFIYSKHNAVPAITPPAEHKDLRDLMENLMDEFLPGPIIMRR